MLRANNRPILAYFDAIKTLRLRQLNLILKAGYDPNLLVNSRGQNGLQFMINYFNGTDAHFLIQAPISKAAYISIAKLLLDSGLDPNLADLLSGETAIFDAIRFNDRDMVALLLNYVDFSLRNKSGETALMCAARFGSKQVMRMILEHLRHLEMDGYFLRQRNRYGLTALELARAENLNCAKVLTKHLIAYGHHTDSVLARSSSHHQLLPRSLPYHMSLASRAPAAALLDDPVSDYDSDFLGTTYQGPLVRGGNKKSRASYKPAGYYDPKAAEFNQYLLGQQDFSSAEQQTIGGQFVGGSSDEDDYNLFGASTSAGNSGLVRSKSCILAPSSNKQKKFSTDNLAGKRGQGEGGSGTKASSSWEAPNGSGRNNMG